MDFHVYKPKGSVTDPLTREKPSFAGKVRSVQDRLRQALGTYISINFCVCMTLRKDVAESDASPVLELIQLDVPSRRSSFGPGSERTGGST